MNHIFKWNGQHLGFSVNGYLFDPSCNYLGWIEQDGSVWSDRGRYVGELIEGQYILRNTMKMQPMARMPKMRPMPPMPPMQPMPRMPRMPRMVWRDPFDQ